MGAGASTTSPVVVYTLDTNALISYSNNVPPVVETVERLFADNAVVYVSTITELELLSSAALPEDDGRRLERFLSTVVCVPVDSHLARIAAYLRRQYRLKTADSAIGATALLTHTTFVTRNARDFEHIPALSLLTISRRQPEPAAEAACKPLNPRPSS